MAARAGSDCALARTALLLVYCAAPRPLWPPCGCAVRRGEPERAARGTAFYGGGDADGSFAGLQEE